MPETAAGRALRDWLGFSPIDGRDGKIDAIEAEARALGRAEALPLRTAATAARDLMARYLWDEDDSGDENDLVEAHDNLRDALAAIDNLETP